MDQFVTEWEQFYRTYHDYGFTTGEIKQKMKAFEEWAKVHPHDTAWTVNLGVDYRFTGQFEKAIGPERDRFYATR